jgi:hypothetical protein
VIGAVAAVLWCAVTPIARAQWDPNPVTGFSTATNYACGPNDNPERGIQGDVGDTSANGAFGGFNCGLSLLGHATLNADGRTPTGNANMAWAGDCAYVAGPSEAIAPDLPSTPGAHGGVAVVYVPPRHPDRPVNVKTLQDPGAAATSETIAAITATNGRSILVVGQYGNTAVDNAPTTNTEDPLGTTKPMDIYDVTDCRNPVHLATYNWPLNIHNLTITQDGNYVIATQPLQVLDISGLWQSPRRDPVWLGNLDKAMQGPLVAVGPSADVDDNVPGANSETHPSYSSHEAYALQENGRTKLYLGGQLPTFEVMTIVDITNWLNRTSGQPAGAPEVISQQSGRGHSVRLATIVTNGKPTRYLLHSEESPFGAGYSCAPETTNPFAGPAQPWLTDIGDEQHPHLVSQMGLAINLPQNCQTQLQRNETNSVHYHDVDNPDDTTFVMASMWNSGLRIFDVRDPTQPTEVGYFNPGDLDPDPATTNLDHAWGHIRYIASKGQIWFATADGGFWVLRIEKGLRTQLGLDKKLRREGVAVPQDVDALGSAGWRAAAADISTPLARSVDVTPYYCTLGTAQGLNTPAN